MTRLSFMAQSENAKRVRNGVQYTQMCIKLRKLVAKLFEQNFFSNNTGVEGRVPHGLNFKQKICSI